MPCIRTVTDTNSDHMRSVLGLVVLRGHHPFHYRIKIEIGLRESDLESESGSRSWIQRIQRPTGKWTDPCCNRQSSKTCQLFSDSTWNWRPMAYHFSLGVNIIHRSRLGNSLPTSKTRKTIFFLLLVLRLSMSAFILVTFNSQWRGFKNLRSIISQHGILLKNIILNKYKLRPFLITKCDWQVIIAYWWFANLKATMQRKDTFLK